MNEPAPSHEADATHQRRPYEAPRLLLPSLSASDAEKTTPFPTESAFADPHYGPAS